MSSQLSRSIVPRLRSLPTRVLAPRGPSVRHYDRPTADDKFEAKPGATILTKKRPGGIRRFGKYAGGFLASTFVLWAIIRMVVTPTIPRGEKKPERKKAVPEEGPFYGTWKPNKS